MSGSLLVKLGVAHRSVSLETIIRDVLPERIYFYHAEKLESGLQYVVVEVEPFGLDDVRPGYGAHERMCDQVTRAIHCVAPGAVRYCNAIWLDNSEWYRPAAAVGHSRPR